MYFQLKMYWTVIFRDRKIYTSDIRKLDKKQTKTTKLFKNAGTVIMGS